MYRIPVRRLIEYKTYQLWEKLSGDFILVFEDGNEIITHEKEVIYSSYFWDLMREYFDTPIESKHFIRNIIKEERLSSNSHFKLLGNIIFSIYDAYENKVPDKVELMDHLTKRGYEIVNLVYNDLTYRLEAYVTSIDILDFIQVTEDPAIKSTMENIEPTQEGIDAVYTAIKERIKDKSYYKDNNLVKAANSGIVNTNQVLQCVGPRGFLTDIDSYIFKKPILKGFTHGLTSLTDAMMESRSAAKALAFSTDPLQQSEYFSRRQQLIDMNVRNLHRGDCGSTEYLIWHVRGPQYEGTQKILDSDLKTLQGKYYWNDDTERLEVIGEKDEHLIGKTIKIRSAVAGCKHPDPYGICEVCYGEASLGIPKNSNLGHQNCVSMTEKITQTVLSTKHLDGSSVVEGIVLKGPEKKFLSAQVNGSIYYLNESLIGKEVKLIIEPTRAYGLTDVTLVTNVEKLNLSRVSDFEFITIQVHDPKKQVTEIVDLEVSVNKRNSNMTYPLLQHIKDSGWTISSEGKYVIDMQGWNYKQPILSLPARHFSMVDHASEIADMLESTVKDLQIRDQVVSPCNMLIEFHDLVNRRLSINLAILEIVVYASMVVSASENDYSLPKQWTNQGLGVMRMLLSNRSMGATAAFERQKNEFLAAGNYLNDNRVDHPFDSLLSPAEMQQYGLIGQM